MNFLSALFSLLQFVMALYVGCIYVVLGDRTVSCRLKGQFYKIVIGFVEQIGWMMTERQVHCYNKHAKRDGFVNTKLTITNNHIRETLRIAW